MTHYNLKYKGVVCTAVDWLSVPTKFYLKCNSNTYCYETDSFFFEHADTDHIRRVIDEFLEKKIVDVNPVLLMHPALDVVVVTRCKNCKWCEDMGMSGLYCNHPDNRNPLGCRPDDYCSDGEPMPAPAPAK